jgi:diapolycopene oxygenase
MARLENPGATVFRTEVYSLSSMKKSPEHRIGIIGAGLGGLAAACTLAARGYSVVLFESNGWLGGKAARLEGNGFRFDMGPTVLTMPSVLRRCFSEAGRRMEAYLDLVRLDPQWRCFFGDGSTLDLLQDPAQMAANLDRFSPAHHLGKRYTDFLQFSESLHRISKNFFFDRPIGGLSDMIEWRSILRPALLRDVLRMRMGSSAASTVRSYISEPRVAQMIDHFTQYVGSSPDNSPAILCAIAHMQTSEGIWYPKGGTYAVPAALGRLAAELAVEIRLDTAIERILHENGRVVGLRTAVGEDIRLDAIVSNSDTVRTHRDLIGASIASAFDKRRTYEPACSGVVLYLGLKEGYQHLAHHNFAFSEDPHQEFEAIYQKGEPAADPTCYFAATASTDRSTAPPGGEALYVLTHTPYLRPHHDWARMLPSYREIILSKLKRNAGMEDIENRIVFERALTPLDIQHRYRVLNGAIYGLASHGKWLGAFKPNNRSPDLRGLYLAGGSAHPGPGMPMALMSGWIAGDALDRDGILPRESGCANDSASVFAEKTR